MMNAILTFICREYATLPFKRHVFEMLRRYVRLPANTYRHLHFVAPIVIAMEDGARFKMHHFGAQVENDLFWSGYGNGYEATSLRLWACLATTADTIFDIGANTGVYALAAKAINAKAHVFAFEPVVSITGRLKSNIELNGFDIEIVPAGVSSSSGEAVMYIPAADHSYSASLNVNMLGGQDNLVEPIVQTVRIDAFVKDRQLASADLFKIDTEKHEVDVLIGFGDVITQFRSLVLIEILDQQLGKRIELFFLDFGYFFTKSLKAKRCGVSVH